MRRKVIFILLSLLMLGAIAFLYINNILLPVKIKGILTSKASELLGRTVELDAVTFDPLKGFTLHNVTIYPDQTSQLPFIQIHKVSFRVLLIPIFKNKHFIIPSITIQDPYVRINAQTDEPYLRDLTQELLKPKANKESKERSFFIRKITLNNGRFDYLDASTTPALTESITQIDLSAALTIERNIAFTLGAESEPRAAAISVDGAYNIADHTATAHLITKNLPLAEYARYISVLDTSNISSGTLSHADIHLKYAPDLWHINGRIDLDQSAIRLNGQSISCRRLQTENLVLDWNSGTLKGGGHIFLSQADITLSNQRSLKGTATANLESLRFSGKDFNVKGELTLNDGSIQWAKTQSISGRELKILSASVDNSDQRLFITGQVKGQDAHLILSPHIQIKGNFSTEETSFRSENKRIDLRSAFTVDKANATFGPNRSFQGTVQTPDIKLMYTSGQLIVRGDLTVDNALFQEGPDKIFKGLLTAGKTQYTRTPEEQTLTGNISIDQADFTLSDKHSIQGNLSAENFSLTANKTSIQCEGPLRISRSQIEMEPAFAFTGDVNASKNVLTFIDGKIQGSHEINLSPESLTVHNQYMFQGGEPFLTMAWERSPKDQVPFSYTGAIHLDGLNTLDGISQTGQIRNTSGTIQLDTNRLSSEGLRLTLMDTAVTLSGNLTNFKKPELNIQTTAEAMSIHQIHDLLPDDITAKIPVDIDGKAAISLAYNGPATPLDTKGITATVELFDANISGKAANLFSQNIHGKIIYTEQTLLAEHLTGLFLGQNITVSGRLQNFAKPNIQSTIQGNNFEIRTQMAVDGKTVHLTSVHAKSGASSADFSGKVNFTDKASPDIALSGSSLIDIDDIKALKIPKTEKLNTLNLEGILDSTFSINGPVSQPLDWSVDASATSPSIHIKGSTIKDITATYIQNKNYVEQFVIKGSLYSGDLLLTAAGPLTQKDFNVTTELSLKAIDLAMLQDERQIKNRNLAGLLNLDVTLQGFLKQPASWKGNGAFAITEGFLWSKNFIEGLDSILLIPEYQTIEFTEGTAEFTIANKRVSTSNGFLDGNVVDLRAKGWIDFDQNIDFQILPQFSQIVLEQTKSLRKIPSSIINHVVQVNVSGSLDNPTFKNETNPIKIIERTSDIIKSGVGLILDGLSQ